MYLYLCIFVQLNTVITGGGGGGGGGSEVKSMLDTVAETMVSNGHVREELLNELTRGAGANVIKDTLRFHDKHPGYVPATAQGRRSQVPDTYNMTVRMFVTACECG